MSSYYENLLEALDKFYTDNRMYANLVECGKDVYDELADKFAQGSSTNRLASIIIIVRGNPVEVIFDPSFCGTSGIYMSKGDISEYKTIVLAAAPVEVVSSVEIEETHKCYCGSYQLFNFGCDCDGI